MLDAIRAQLVATRAQIDATLAMLDGLHVESAPAQELPVCPHTETENIGTFGAPRFKCLTCQQIVEPSG